MSSLLVHLLPVMLQVKDLALRQRISDTQLSYHKHLLQLFQPYINKHSVELRQTDKSVI
jgi:hypothetical protein